MKKLLSTAVLIIAVATLLTSCKICKEKQFQTAQTAQLMDQNVSSDYFGDNVAAFNFSINQTENAKDKCIDSYESKVNMTIVNLTEKTITFSYVAEYLGAWSISGSATIPPYGSVDKGVVSTVGDDYTMNFFQVSSSNISYQ